MPTQSESYFQNFKLIHIRIPVIKYNIHMSILFCIRYLPNGAIAQSVTQTTRRRMITKLERAWKDAAVV